MVHFRLLLDVRWYNLRHYLSKDLGCILVVVYWFRAFTQCNIRMSMQCYASNLVETDRIAPEINISTKGERRLTTFTILAPTLMTMWNWLPLTYLFSELLHFQYISKQQLCIWGLGGVIIRFQTFITLYEEELSKFGWLVCETCTFIL